MKNDGFVDTERNQNLST